MTTNGSLMLIGGHEDRDPKGRRTILREVARRIGGGKLVLATVASRQPEGYLEEYRAAFQDLGIGDLVELYLEDRREAESEEKLALLDGAAGIFFSGGDQLRITSQVGDTPIERKVRHLYARGGLVAGTSAGATAMSEIMLVGGARAETHRIGDLYMAPGLGLIRNVIVDQHFAERGRFGRLLGAVAQNPRALGMGVDEDTAAIVEGSRFHVIGAGAVYIFDGQHVSHSNVSEARPHHPLSLYDMRVHVLGTGDRFDLDRRRSEPAGKEVGSVA